MHLTICCKIGAVTRLVKYTGQRVHLEKVDFLNIEQLMRTEADITGILVGINNQKTECDRRIL